MFTPRQWSRVNQWVQHVPSIPTTSGSVHAVIIHLGHTVPWHLYECLQQLATFDTPCILVVSSNFVGSWFQNIPQVQVWVYDDRNIVKEIEKVQPSGLFTFSIARFYALSAAMQKFNLEACIHMEHDNLVYASGAWLTKTSRNVCGQKLGITRDSAKRCIAGWVWIGSREALDSFLDYMSSQKYAKLEMFLLCDFLELYPNYAIALPVVPPDALVSFSQPTWPHLSVFDAAALGQWVGGIDLLHSENDTRGFINETAEYNPDMLDFAWGSDSFGRTVPVIKYNNVSYRVLNLHLHCKRLYPFLSSPCRSYDIIQGHKFRDLASSLGDSTVFVVSDDIATVRPILENATSPIVVISHNSDHALEPDHLDMLNHPMLTWWFAQNLNVHHPKTSPLPIGLANEEWEHGNVSKFREALSGCSERKYPILYANFSVGTHASRVEFLERAAVLNHDFKTDNTRLSPFENWRRARQSALVGCPRGNGIDTHRLWETWYSNSMPVRYHPDKKAWNWPFQHLGLPWVDLENVTLATPHQDSWSRWNHARYYTLRFTYWANLIRRKLHPPATLPWDACLVVHSKDYQWVGKVVDGLRRYTSGCRRIYVVTNNPKQSVGRWPTVTLVDEKDIEPCSIEFVRQFGFAHRSGWYYQQLLKLNLDLLPECLERVLVMDADTVLCQHTVFWDDYGRALFSQFPIAEPYYKNYILRLCPSWAPLCHVGCTSVVHHMPFEVSSLCHMKKAISLSASKSGYSSTETMLNKGRSFHEVFLNGVLPSERLKSGVSEYELYFQYQCHTAPEKVVVRQIRHTNTSNVDLLSHCQHPYTMVSVHSWLRN